MVLLWQKKPQNQTANWTVDQVIAPWVKTNYSEKSEIVTTVYVRDTSG